MRAWVTGWAAASAPRLQKSVMYGVFLYLYVYLISRKFYVAIRSFWFDPHFLNPLNFFYVDLTYSEVRVAMSYVVALGARVRRLEARPHVILSGCD